MRPRLQLLDEPLINRILDEARDVLAKIGVEIHNDGVLALLADHGAPVDGTTRRVRIPAALVDKALATAPAAIRLYDVLGTQTHDLSGTHVHFTPGSAAILVLDFASGTMRRPTTADYVRHVKLVSGLANIAAQSTALIPSDVSQRIQDSYRLYLSLVYGEKPVVTGAFTVESFDIMREMQVAVRGSAQALREKPLTVFSCCPTSPLKWSNVTSQNLVDCALAGIPTELVSMPLAGFMAPVTLVGSLVTHAAETLSGYVIGQLAAPGAPILWGGSPAVFDVRYETTPMGAIETMMIDCAYSEVGKHLGLPTQAYISLSDSKLLDAQAGLETGMGAVLAAASGINSISGPGMLDFESCLSLEKLVLDNEICRMTERLVAGIEPRDDFPAAPLLSELMREHHLLIADHTLRHLRSEISFPGPVIDRANRSRWRSEGGRTLGQRAAAEVERLVAAWQPPPLPDGAAGELTRVMAAEARRWGMEKLPERPA